MSATVIEPGTVSGARDAEGPIGPTPPLTPRLQLLRAVLVLIAVLSGSMIVQMLLVSRLQHSAAQARSFDRLRSQLANGTVPIGPTTGDGAVVTLGSPVAYLEIGRLGLKEVVGEGTTSGVLFDGPGHRRDTPLPGQVGTSILFGRRALFGGPFSGLDRLRPGDTITVTTGQGTFDFTVLGVRREGDPLPPPVADGGSRLVLTTADGTAFVPNGVLRVDADLDGDAVGGARRLVSASSLPLEERQMHGDARTLWVLVLWLQALIGLSIAAVWSWHRWGRAQTWVVFLPPLILVGLQVASELLRLFPNVM